MNYKFKQGLERLALPATMLIYSGYLVYIYDRVRACNAEVIASNARVTAMEQQCPR